MRNPVPDNSAVTRRIYTLAYTPLLVPKRRCLQSFFGRLKRGLPRGRKNISRSERARSFHGRRDIFTRARIELVHRGETFRHAWTNAEIFLTLPRPLPDASMCLRHIFQNIQLPFVLSLSSSSSSSRCVLSFSF